MVVSGTSARKPRPAHRTWLAVITAALCVGLTAMLVVAAVISTRLKDIDIAAQLNTWLGVAVTWRGELAVSMFPVPEIAVTDVTVQSRHDADAPALAAIPKLNVSLRLLPLFMGRVEVDTLVLDEPHVHVSRELLDAARPASGTFGLHALFAPHAGPRLGRIVLHDAVIRYGDDGISDADAIRAADLHVTWNRTDGTMAVAGSFVWRGRAVEIDADLDEPMKIFSGSGSRGRLMLAPTRRVGAADGSSLGPVRVDGSFRLVRGSVDGLAESLLISDAGVRTGDTAGRGFLAVSRVNDRPIVEGSLVFDQLDLAPYVDAWLPRSVAELLAMPMTDRWLGFADVDLDVWADLVDFGGVRFDDTRLKLLTRDSRMSLQVADAGLAGGRMEGILAVKPAAQGIAVELSGRLDGMSLADAGEHLQRGRTTTLIGAEQPPQGSGTATFDVVVEGPTIGAMIQSLAGRAGVDIRDGSLDGADTISTLERVVDGEAGIAEGEAPFIPMAGRTYFSRLTALLVAGDGVASAERIHLAGERFEITLSGELDLTGGELTAEGTASLFDAESGDGRNILVELPFGVGGTIRDPMGAPGIPRGAAHPQRRTVQYQLSPQPAASDPRRAGRSGGRPRVG